MFKLVTTITEANIDAARPCLESIDSFGYGIHCHCMCLQLAIKPLKIVYPHIRFRCIKKLSSALFNSINATAQDMIMYVDPLGKFQVPMWLLFRAHYKTQRDAIVINEYMPSCSVNGAHTPYRPNAHATTTMGNALRNIMTPDDDLTELLETFDDYKYAHYYDCSIILASQRNWFKINAEYNKSHSKHHKMLTHPKAKLWLLNKALHDTNLPKRPFLPRETLHVPLGLSQRHTFDDGIFYYTPAKQRKTKKAVTYVHY